MPVKKDPSRRVRYELVYRRVQRSSSQNVPSDPIIPFPNGTVRFFCASPGSKLPGLRRAQSSATITSSLRYKNLSSDLSTKSTPHQRSSTSTNAERRNAKAPDKL